MKLAILEIIKTHAVRNAHFKTTVFVKIIVANVKMDLNFREDSVSKHVKLINFITKMETARRVKNIVYKGNYYYRYMWK